MSTRRGIRPGLDLLWTHGRKLEDRARFVPRGAGADVPRSASLRRSRPCSCDAVSTIPVEARAFLEPEGVAYDPLLLGDMARP